MPRWGYGRPPHPILTQIIRRHRERYEHIVDDVVADEGLGAIQMFADPGDPLSPSWANDMFPALDAAALMAILEEVDPPHLYEVGSGNSTKFARFAIQRHALRTRIVSIDPHPRSEIDHLCDEIVRSPVEGLDTGFFTQLQSGDILFLDGSHRALTNSDATMLWLDVLPYLAPGVVVHVHDVFLPYDYPPEWGPRFYSEQYLLAASLLAGADFDLLFASHFVQEDEGLYTKANRRFESLGIPEAHRGGGSFWFAIGSNSIEG